MSKMHMIGGKLLSNGAFGCVYHPQINCNGTINDKSKSSNKFASKIQKSSISSDNEVHISNLIKNIHNYRDFFAPIESECEIDINLLKNGNIEQCELFDKYKKGDFTIMKMNYISGGDFSKYIGKLIKNKSKNTKLLIKTLIHSYIYLLGSLEKLVQNNIVHYDLKGNNVLYDIDKNRPIIVDFGLSIDMNDKNKSMQDSFYTYSPRYYLWSPEIHLLSYLNNKSQTIDKNDVKLIVSDLKHENYIFENIYSNEFIERYYKLLEKVFSRYINKPKHIIEQKLIKYYYTWDNYSLSMMYLKFIKEIYINGFVKNKLINIISEILILNLHPNPKKRLSIKQTINRFKYGLK